MNVLAAMLAKLMGAGANAAQLATIPSSMCLSVFCGIFGLVGGAEVFRSLKGKAEAKRQDELKKELDQRLKPFLKSWGMTAEELDLVDILDPKLVDPSKYSSPLVALYLFLRRELDTQQQTTAELTTKIEVLLQSDRRFEEVLPQLLRRVADDIPETRALLDDGLRSLDQHLNDLDNKLDRLLGLRAELPQYRYQTGSTSLAQRFVYRYRRIPLVGRASMLPALERFLEYRDRPVEWWLWHGPGGSGKSRLAHDLCLQVDARGGYARFILQDDPDSFSRLADWHPDRPALLVFDYAATHAAKLGRALASLAGRKFRHRVRILLLERDGDGNARWREEFENRDHATVRSALEAIRHGEPLLVSPLDENALWRCATQVFQETSAPTPDRKRFLTSLREIDPQGRPLFAVMAAEAVADRNNSTLPIDATSLVNYVLERELALWRKAGVDEDHLDLLVFATMTQRMPLKAAVQLLREYGAKYPESPRPNWLQMAAGFTPDPTVKDEVRPLEPDMLGELLVLGRLAGTAKVSDVADYVIQERTKKLRDLAWMKCGPLQMCFSIRSVLDQPAHAGVPLLFDDFPADCVTCRVHFANAVAATFPIWSLHGNDRLAQAALDQVATFSIIRGENGEAVSPSVFQEIAFLNRGFLHGQECRYLEEIADYTRAIDFGENVGTRLDHALFNRGQAFSAMESFESAILDFTRCIALPGAATVFVAGSLVQRAKSNYFLGRHAESTADYSACIELCNAPPKWLAHAYYHRGLEHEQSQRTSEAIADYTRCIGIPEAPSEVLAGAFISRAFLRIEEKQVVEAIADFTDGINLQRAPTEELARVFLHRGSLHMLSNCQDEAIEDWSRCIELVDAPNDTVARASYSRGCWHMEAERYDDAISDYTRCIELPGVRPDAVTMALVNRGVVNLLKKGDIEAGRRDLMSALSSGILAEEHYNKLLGLLVHNSEQIEFPRVEPGPL